MGSIPKSNENNEESKGDSSTVGWAALSRAFRRLLCPLHLLHRVFG